MSDDSDGLTAARPAHLHIVQGGKTREADARGHEADLELPVVCIELPGVKAVRRADAAHWLHEVEHEVLAALPDEELVPLQALLKYGLQDQHEDLEPGEAARLLLTTFLAHGALTHRRRRILTAIPEHSARLSVPAPTYLSIDGWLERWWDALKFS